MLSFRTAFFIPALLAVNLFMRYTVTNNEAKNRFEVREDDEISFLDYLVSDGYISLLHTEVPEVSGGKGIASSLSEYAFQYASEKNLQVKIYCAFVVTYVKRHPDLQSIVHQKK